MQNNKAAFLANGTGVIDASWYDKSSNPKVKERISAGGVVVRVARDATLMVALARHHNEPDYVLPKGGVDKEESFLEAAEREIAEEAGFKRLRYLSTLATLERFNYRKTRWSITHYFLFLTDEIEVTPSESERHAPPHWYPLEAVPKLFWPEQSHLIASAQKQIYRQVAHYQQHHLAIS